MERLTDIQKKTQGIVTAIYMVSEYLSDTEPLRQRMRELSLKLASALYPASPVTAMDASAELRSLLGVAQALGLVSRMNARIIDAELSRLLETFGKQDGLESMRVSTLVLPDGLFSRAEDGAPKHAPVQAPMQRTDSVSVSTARAISAAPAPSRGPSDKAQRKDQILSVIKSKYEKTGIIIKDILAVFPGLSEKTIQRELVEMVSNGQLKKTGEKRWSRYYLG